MVQTFKVCSLCNLNLPLSSFHKDSKKKLGVRSRCKSCVKPYAEKYRDSNRSFVQASSRKSYRKYEEKRRSYGRTYAKEYYQNNKEEVLERNKTYSKVNNHKVNAKRNKRRAKKLKATPIWLTKDHLREIENYYWLTGDLEKVSGEKYDVDHIVPLNGKKVCGLHVPWNLQVLPRDLNQRKSNGELSSLWKRSRKR